MPSRWITFRRSARLRRSASFISVSDTPLFRPQSPPDRSGKQPQHFALDPGAGPRRDGPVALGAWGDRRSVAVAIEQARVDVGGAADRRRVAERLGDAPHRGRYRALRRPAGG